MKNLLLLFVTAMLILIHTSLYAQNLLVLCEDEKEELLESGKNLVVVYTRLVETLAMETDFEIQSKIKEKIYQLVEHREIQVEDDLTDYSHQGRRFTLDNYLTNIHYDVSASEEVYYEVSEPTEIFYQPDLNFYYTLIDAKKNVKRTEGDAMYLRSFVVKIDQIEKNLPILRISDITMKRPEQMIVGNALQTRSCFKEIKPLTFQMTDEAVYRRENKSAYTIEWQGGILEDSLVVELIKFNKKGEMVSIDTILNEFQNTGYYTQWYMQNNKTGSYKLRMSKMNVNEPPVWSETFKIKRRIPLAYSVGIPLVVVGGGLALYYFVIYEEEEDPLPRPPEPN